MTGADIQYFRSRYSSDPRRNRAWSAVCDYLQRYIPQDGTVLDLGAGYCSFINNIRAGRKHALDSFSGFESFAGNAVQTKIGPCTDLSHLETQSVDVVFASNLLEHLTRDDTSLTLHEIRRILKVDGRFIALQPNFRYAYREYFDDFTHRQIFTHIGLVDLLSTHGFEVERADPRFLPFSFKNRFPIRRWLVWLYLRLPVRPFAKQMLVVARVKRNDGVPGARSIQPISIASLPKAQGPE